MNDAPSATATAPRRPLDPPVCCYAIAGIMSPWQHLMCRELFEHIPRDRPHLLVTVADRVGSGRYALALADALDKARRHHHASGGPVAPLVTMLNCEVHRLPGCCKSVTLFCGEVDPTTHRLVYVNAGQYALLVRGQTEVYGLDRGGPPMGVFDGFEYEEGTVALEPDDVLLVYDDAICEASNRRGETFGADRLVEAARNSRGSASQVLESIHESLRRFLRGSLLVDPLVVVVKRMI